MARSRGSSAAIPLAARALFLYTARALLGAVPVGPWGMQDPSRAFFRAQLWLYLQRNLNKF